MTKEETREILMVIQTAYPNYNPPNKSFAINTWQMMLEDYDYKDVNASLKSFIATDTKGFAPAIGQIIDGIHKLTDPQELNGMEAWSLVSKAIRNGGYHSQEEFDALPELVQKAVGSPTQIYYMAMSTNYNEDVARSNFLKQYEILLKRDREYRRLPESSKKLIDQTASKMIGGDASEDGR